MTAPGKGLQFVVVLVVGLLAFFVDLGQEVRIDGREVTHAEIAREMAETGDYAVPCVLGRPYPKKPVLFNWVVAGLFRLTGRSDFVLSRLPSALSALAIMLGLYVLGRRWLSGRAGFWAALAWPTFLVVGEWAHLARADMMMTALIFWAVLLADFSAAATGRRAAAALWGGASLLVSGAVMAKGLQALVFFVVPVAALWRARRGRWLPPAWFPLTTVAIVAACAVGWLLAAEAGAPGHLKALVDYEFGQGFGEHPKRLSLYIDQFLLTTLPWSVFAAGAVACAIRRFRRGGYGLWAVPAVTLGVCLAILTVTVNKRAHYALPIFPMWALLLAGFMDAGAGRVRTAGATGEGGAPPDGEKLFRWSFDWPLRLVLLTVFGLLSAAPFYWASHAHAGKAIGAAVLTAAAACAAGGVVASWRGNLRRAVVALMTVVLIVTVVGRPLATDFYLRPPAVLNAIAQVSQTIPPGAPLAEHGVRYELLYLKMNRPVAFLDDEAAMQAFLQKDGERYLIAREEDVPAIEHLAGRPLKVIGKWPLGGKGEIPTAVLATSP